MRIRRFTAALLALALGALGLAGVLGAAPAGAIQDNTLPGNTASSWQTNGTVWAIAAANDVVYLGGDFTSVRPPGSNAGSNEVGRNHLAAFNASTGALITSFNHSVNGAVRSLATSPDGSTLYAGGQFTSIDGTARTRLAAFSTSSGAMTSWAPTADGTVSSIAPTATKVYLGGSFGRINSKANTRIVAEVSASNGTVDAGFVTTVDNIAYAIALSPDNSTLYLAGAFTQVNGDATRNAVGAVSATNGSNVAFPAGAQVIGPNNPGCTVQVKAVRADSNGVYFGAEGTGGGCFDGTFAASLQDGSLKWVSRCLGATQSVQPINGVLYTGSHSHDCTADQANDPDAFPEVGWSRGLSRHLLSRSTETGEMTSWYPNTNGGPGGAGLGPRVMASDGTQLFVGGEFTSVNGVNQQGFARFSPTTADAQPAAPARPVAVATSDSQVKVYVQAPLDLDDVDLTLNVFRDGGSTPIGTAQVHSLFWKQPVVAITDNGVAAGSNHTYTAQAVDTNGGVTGPRSAASASVHVAAPVSYAAAVTADDPSLFYRFNEAAGPTVGDGAGNAEGGTYGPSGITYNQAGATGDGDRAISLSGTTVSGNFTNGSYITSSKAIPSPTTYSVEAWFKTTTTAGGKIIGFGDSRGGYDFGGNTAVSGQYDKQIYMTNSGQLTFGVWVGFADTLTSTTSYNDGGWHHVVGTQGGGGMSLYVDGLRVGHDGQTSNQSYTGYWRIGGDNLGGWPNQPSSSYLAGQIDDVAVYDQALNLGQVDDHFAASGRTPPPSVIPTDNYGKTVYQDGASTYWRLNETSGTTAVDSSTNGNDGLYSGGVTQGAAGAIGTGTAATFNGSDGNVSSTAATGGPSVYSLELWFNTTTDSGGKLIGFGNAQTGDSGSYDKQVYMLNDGRLVFGVYNGSFDTIYTPTPYNNGNWHHVVATQGPSGMALYVDDQLIGSNGVTSNQGYGGYWRVGGDNLNAWPDQPPSRYFAGTIDEVAVYGGVLNAGQVDDHYVASGRSGHDANPPDVAITAPADGDTIDTGATSVTVDATDAGGVASVELQVDGSTVDTDTSAPYAFSWNATAGAHTLTAIATDNAGNAETSDPVHVTATTPDVTPPSPPTGLAAGSVTATTVDLSWNAATDDRAVTGYMLVRDGAVVSSPTGLSATDTGLSPGVTYVYTVRAVDAAGNTGADSDPVSVTTPAALYQDTFTGANGAAWPAGWTTSVSNGSATLQSNAGTLQSNDVANAYSRAQLTGLAAVGDTDTLLSYQWNSTTATAYFSVFARGSGGWLNGYRPRTGYGLQFQSNSGTVAVQRDVNGTLTTLGTVGGGQQVSTAKHWLRLRVAGSTIQFRTWLDGAAEPTTWATTVTDSAVTAPGQLFLSLNRAGSNSGVKSVSVDDVKVGVPN